MTLEMVVMRCWFCVAMASEVCPLTLVLNVSKFWLRKGLRVWGTKSFQSWSTNAFIKLVEESFQVLVGEWQTLAGPGVGLHLHGSQLESQKHPVAGHVPSKLLTIKQNSHYLKTNSHHYRPISLLSTNPPAFDNISPFIQSLS